MRVRNKYQYEELEVFGFYEVASVKYFLCSPEGYIGLLTLSEKDVEVIDITVGDSYIPYKSDTGIEAMVNQFIIENDLLEGLIECAPEYYEKFKDICENRS